MIAREGYIEIGKRIREERLRLYWSQTRLASESGLTQSGVSKYENGNRIMNVITLRKISDAMGIPMDYFARGE